MDIMNCTLVENVVDMLKKRNYTVIQKNTNNNEIECTTDTGHKCIVIFTNQYKINTNYLKICIQDTMNRNITRVILIHNGNITVSVKKIIELNKQQSFELFQTVDFIYNITKHDLVPLHEKVVDLKEEFSESAIKDLCNLPVLLSTEPISKFYNYKTGDVVRITRRSGIVIYRIVV
jgi:DNA-directed RNA polymerase subunit H (RpoH/RPB5)